MDVAAHKLYSAAFLLTGTVISTGVIIADDSAVKNRYSCEE